MSGKRAALEKQLPVPHWPTRAEAEAMRWFSPVAIRSLTLAERTWVPAMVPWRATDDGVVTPGVLAWYERFAKGEPGAIVVEATGIRDVASGPLLRIGHDRYIPGLSEVVARVKKASGGRTKVFIQIIDFLAVRRRPAKEKFFAKYLMIDDALRSRIGLSDEVAIRARLATASEEEIARLLSPRDLESFRMGYRERVTDTHLPHIAELPKILPGLFADAAARAKTAGFDGVELHFAHAYTMSSFLSKTNTRSDGYGGPRENRVRLPLEVIAAVRASVGDWAVGCRYLGDEVIEGGNRIDDAAWFGIEFARAGLDFLSVSKGGKFDDAKQPREGEAVYPYTGKSGEECMPTVWIDGKGPYSRNVGLAREIRAAVRSAGFTIPVVTAGGIASPWQAEEILALGEADIVAAARQSLADPDWFRKIRLGRGAEVRRCLFTNYCESLDQRHRAVTCQLWDRDFADGNPTGLVALDGKRRLTAPEWS